LRLLWLDDASQPGLAARNMERLAGDGAHVLIGPYGSDLALAAARATAALGRLLWNQGGASDSPHEVGGRVIGLMTPAWRYFTAFPDLARALGCGSGPLVVVHREGRFGRECAAGALQAATAAGLEAVVLPYHRPEELPSLARTAGNAPVLLAATPFEDGVALARALLALPRRPLACGLVAAALADFGRALGEKAEGFLAPSQWEPALPLEPDMGPPPREVARRLVARGAEPDYTAAQAFAAGLIAGHCLERAGTTDEEAVWRAALSLRCTTFFGHFALEPGSGRQVGHDVVWVQWRGGHKVTVWPPWAGAPSGSLGPSDGGPGLPGTPGGSG